MAAVTRALLAHAAARALRGYARSAPARPGLIPRAMRRAARVTAYFAGEVAVGLWCDEQARLAREAPRPQPAAKAEPVAAAMPFHLIHETDANAREYPRA